MKTVEAVQHFGSVIKVAKALGITRSAVYQWGDVVPKGRAYELQFVTGGVLRAVSDSYQRPHAQQAG